MNLPLRCVVCGGRWVVLWCALKLDTRYVDSGASCEEFRYRHRSATASVLAGATGVSYKVIC